VSPRKKIRYDACRTKGGCICVTLVDPSRPCTCEFCHGELRFERIEPDNLVFDIEVGIIRLRKWRPCALARDDSRPVTPHTPRGICRTVRRVSRAKPAAIDTRDARSRIGLISLADLPQGVGSCHGRLCRSECRFRRFDCPKPPVRSRPILRIGVRLLRRPILPFGPMVAASPKQTLRQRPRSGAEY